MTAELNALPLLLTVSETFNDSERETPFDARVAHAAVHGWMDGHLSSPGHILDPANVGDMPESPFPRRGDPRSSRSLTRPCVVFAKAKNRQRSPSRRRSAGKPDAQRQENVRAAHQWATVTLQR